jgi:hypothetical protein
LTTRWATNIITGDWRLEAGDWKLENRNEINQIDEIDETDKIEMRNRILLFIKVFTVIMITIPLVSEAYDINISIAQKKLKDMGYYTGRVDGIYGPKTERAIREFQRRHHLPETGRLDRATKRMLDQTTLRPSATQKKEKPSVSYNMKGKPTIFSRKKGFATFREECRLLRKRVSCRNTTVLPADRDYGALFSCIEGVGKTVKLFVNEEKGTGRVRNIKLIWNDWRKDMGEGVHTDRAEAFRVLKGISSIYAPGERDALEAAFSGNINRTIITERFSIRYTFQRGPAIDERMVVITERK